MIIPRQKSYSDFTSFTNILAHYSQKIGLDWLKGIGRTVIDALKNFAKKFKHFIAGKPTKEHETNHTESKQKSFSDLSLNSDFNVYSKVIPGYSELVALSEIGKDMFKKQQIPANVGDNIFKYFPSYFGVVDPETINKYRKDYIDNNNGDWAEILFLYGGELVYVWDFDKNSWYVLDKTHTPVKEFKLVNNNIFLTILQNFDPEKDNVLKMRLEYLEKSNPNAAEFFKSYCKLMQDMTLYSAKKLSQKL